MAIEVPIPYGSDSVNVVPSEIVRNLRVGHKFPAAIIILAAEPVAVLVQIIIIADIEKVIGYSDGNIKTKGRRSDELGGFLDHHVGIGNRLRGGPVTGTRHAGRVESGRFPVYGSRTAQNSQHHPIHQIFFHASLLEEISLPIAAGRSYTVINQ
jgi:hypothetical protein